MALEIFKLKGSIFVDSKDAEKSIARTDKKASGLAKSMANGVKSVAKVGAAVSGVAVATAGMLAKVAADYETSFAKVNTLLVGNQEDIKNYKDELLKASSETGIAADEMSEAVYSAISASVDQKDAIEFAKQASELAKGGFTDTATAVDVLTTAINAYGMEASDATKIADMLITTQNLGKTTVGELASSMGKIIPTANSYGVQIDTLCGAYAEMTKNGIATAESTTYMNSMLNELGKAGTGASKILKEKTGKSFKELMNSGKDITDVLAILNTEAKKNGKSMADMFGSAEAGKAANVLISNATDLNKCIAEMGNSAGATKKAAEIMADTVEAKMNKIKTNITNVAITLGGKVLPVVDKGVEFVLEYMPKIETAISTAFSIAKQYWEQYGKPIFDGLVGEGGKATEFFENTFPKIKDVAMVVFEDAKEYAKTFIDLIVKWFPVMQEKAQKMADALVYIWESYIAPYLPEIYETFKSLVDDMIELWDEHLMPAYMAITDFIQNVLWPAFEQVFVHLLQPVIENWVNYILSMWENSLKPALGAIIDFITNVFSGNFAGAFQNIVDLVDSIWSGLIETIKIPINGAIAIVNSFSDTIVNAINGLIDALNMLNIDVPDWVEELTGMSSFGFDIDHIPQGMKAPFLAKGGSVRRSGNAIVGEAGPELLTLPRGAQVTPLNNNNNAFAKMEKTLDAMLNMMSVMAENMGQDIFLDGNTLVGGTADRMDSALGTIALKRKRGVR